MGVKEKEQRARIRANGNGRSKVERTPTRTTTCPARAVALSSRSFAVNAAVSTAGKLAQSKFATIIRKLAFKLICCYFFLALQALLLQQLLDGDDGAPLPALCNICPTAAVARGFVETKAKRFNILFAIQTHFH